MNTTLYTIKPLEWQLKDGRLVAPSPFGDFVVEPVFSRYNAVFKSNRTTLSEPVATSIHTVKAAQDQCEESHCKKLKEYLIEVCPSQ